MKQDTQKYILSENGYQALSQLGIDAQDMLKIFTTTLPEKSPELKWRKKERFNHDKLKDLFGANWHGIVYYNFDKRSSWHVSRKLEAGERALTQSATDTQDILNSGALFAHREIVASVVMEIAPKDFPGFGKVMQRPEYAPQGGAFVGTIVTRSLVNGRIEPLADTWIGVSNNGIGCGQYDEYGAELFTRLLSRNFQYRQGFLNAWNIDCMLKTKGRE